MYLIINTAVEGYVLFVSNLNKETQEDDIKDLFNDYGPVKRVATNIDRGTGFMKVCIECF